MARDCRLAQVQALRQFADIERPFGKGINDQDTFRVGQAGAELCM